MSWLWLTFPSGWAETDDSFQKQLWRNVPRLIIKEEKFETMVSRNHDCSVAVDAPLLCPHYWYLSGLYHRLSCGSSLEDWQYILLVFNFQGSGIEGRRRGNKGWDGWMASATPWTWVWANSSRQWRTGKPGMLQSMRSQRVGHHLNEQQINICLINKK